VRAFGEIIEGRFGVLMGDVYAMAWELRVRCGTCPSVVHSDVAC
jgi:hypothetical protein